MLYYPWSNIAQRPLLKAQVNSLHKLRKQSLEEAICRCSGQFVVLVSIESQVIYVGEGGSETNSELAYSLGGKLLSVRGEFRREATVCERGSLGGSNGL